MMIALTGRGRMSLASTPGVTTNIRKEELSPRLGRFLLDVDRSTTPPSPQLQHRPLHLSNNGTTHQGTLQH